ncbi:MAG TPA: aspartate/glutamate racemase family protein [bacterium]|nr:aspartate/glutamate racemase family protein [bacterium]
MITPSSNTVVEPLTTRILASLTDAVTVHFTRVRVTHISLQDASLEQFTTDAMLAAARLLADASVDVIAWNGTSGSWKGLEADRTLVAAIEDETGVPATTSTLDLLEACRRLEVRRYGLATPYLRDVHEAIRRTYAAAGLEAVASAHLGITVNREFADVPLPRIDSLLREVAVPEAHAVAVVCTNFPAAAVAARVEEATGRPVIDTLAATAWRTLRLAGLRRPIGGFGQLLARL